MPELMTPQPELAKILEQWNSQERLAGRIAELEAAIRIITHRNRVGSDAIVNSYMEDVDLREFAPILESVHN